MKLLAPGDRPREKLERLGPSGLGDNELLAIVFGHGSRTLSALDLANQVLAHTDGLQGLTRVSRDDLCRIDGVGAARASQVLAAIELGRRTLRPSVGERPQLASPREAAAFLMPAFSARRVEQVGVVLLDARLRLIRVAVVSVGTLDRSVFHPRDVFREAVVGGASAVLVFHNHPSGDPQPSRDDEVLTWRLVELGDLMGIEVMDHLVLADARYFSFREAGRLRGG